MIEKIAELISKLPEDVKNNIMRKILSEKDKGQK